MTYETTIPKKPNQNLDALEMVTGGAPIERTLQCIAAMSTHVHDKVRCAILLLENEKFRLIADHKLLQEDRNFLNQLSAQASHIALSSIQRFTHAYVKSLITPASEIVGALVILGLNTAAEGSVYEREFYDICWMATLAIEQKHLAEELAYRAHHDALTHLWNRVWMEEEIQRALTISGRARTKIGLIIIGVDRFRIINDVLGYQVGNELLCQIAKRMAGKLKQPYSLARGGGDEFMVLMPNLSTPEQVSKVSHEIFECFSRVFEIGQHELMVNTSIGTTVVDAASCSSTELERQAYTALRYAKKQTRGRVVSFHASMIRIPPERLVMEQHLRFALPKGEFEVYYQPQVDLSTERMVGVEALLRWKHAALGFISPAVFIPLAEEIGLIEEIGDWVLDQAIRQCEEWQTLGLSDIRISVNVSTLQFARPDFGSCIENKLKYSRIQPSQLELEITESAIMTNFEHALRQMNLLRKLGVTLAIDDFGTGHSSLAYLQQLPVQRLKIDRMFVKDIVHREDRPALLPSIVHMAHALKLSSVAEGAETVEQLAVLRDLQCDDVQGYVYSKPIPAPELLEWARKRNVLSSSSVALQPCASL